MLAIRIAPKFTLMELQEFLVKAKIGTYAAVGDVREERLPDGKKELRSEEGEWLYKDTYYGSEPFIGEEIVWKAGQMVWGMNYYGKCISNSVTPKEIYGFLKKAMRNIGADRPFRGPSKFEEEDWLYTDISTGSIQDFSGHEEIYFKGEKVYDLLYHGGHIKT